MSDKFTLNVGKQDIALGGYEYYVFTHPRYASIVSLMIISVAIRRRVAGRFNLSLQ